MSDSLDQLDSKRSKPRILLFGLASAGKTSLAGALLQASATQTNQLGFTISDPPQSLELLRDHIYHDLDFIPHHSEIHSLTLEIEPQANEIDPTAFPESFELIDCDGKAATALLRNTESIRQSRVKGLLASVLINVDLLALVINANANDREMEPVFTDFTMLLEAIHGRKVFGREVGGFPIFVVLSQCDQLVKKEDSPTDWETRVEKKLQYVVHRFNDFLEENCPALEQDESYLPFGSFDFQEYAVALRRPELLSDPAPPNEPFGVANFFRDAVLAAQAHKLRSRRSELRLRTTLGSVVLFVLSLVVIGLGMLVYQPSGDVTSLDERIRDYEIHEQPAAVRLSDGQIARTKRILNSFRLEPSYFGIEPGLRDFVEGRITEIENYLDYRDRLAAAPTPAEARSLDELDRVQTILETELALPAKYTWSDTHAAKIREKWLTDIRILRAAESDWFDWFRGLINQGLILSLTPSFEGNWRGRVSDLDSKATHLPFELTTPLPGSLEVLDPRGKALTYQAAFDFDRVYQARREWETAHLRLLNERDLANLLGLTGSIGGSEGLLAIPPPSAGIDSSALPGRILDELRRANPRMENSSRPEYPEWETQNFPEPGRSLLNAKIRESITNATRHFQSLFLEQLNRISAVDSPDRYRTMAAELEKGSFRNWGHVINLLSDLVDSTRSNPLEELVRFLKTEQFPIVLNGFELAIPIALQDSALKPIGPMKLRIQSRNGPPLTRIYAYSGETIRKDLIDFHRFKGDSGFEYRRGDELTLSIPMQAGMKEWRIQWGGDGCRSFQFDQFQREPKLVTPGNAIDAAPGVHLVLSPTSIIPKWPLLLPETK